MWLPFFCSPSLPEERPHSIKALRTRALDCRSRLEENFWRTKGERPLLPCFICGWRSVSCVCVARGVSLRHARMRILCGSGGKTVTTAAGSGRGRVMTTYLAFVPAISCVFPLLSDGRCCHLACKASKRGARWHPTNMLDWSHRAVVVRQRGQDPLDLNSALHVLFLLLRLIRRSASTWVAGEKAAAPFLPLLSDSWELFPALEGVSATLPTPIFHRL